MKADFTPLFIRAQVWQGNLMSEIRGAFQKSSIHLYEYGSENFGKISLTEQLPILCMALGNSDHALLIHYLNARLTMGPIEKDGGEIIQIGVERDGRRWIWNSQEFWRLKVLPHTSLSTIKRIFKSLVKNDIILSRDDLAREYLNGRDNPNLERINFITINYEVLDRLVNTAKAQYKSNQQEYLRSNTKKRKTKKGASSKSQIEPSCVYAGYRQVSGTYPQPNQNEPAPLAQNGSAPLVQNDTQSKHQELHSNSNLNINNTARFYENLALDGFLPDHWVKFINEYLPGKSRNAFLDTCKNKIIDNTDLIYLAYPKKKDRIRVDTALAKLPKSKRPHVGYIIDDIIFKSCLPEILKTLDALRRPLGIETFYPAHCDPVRYVKNQRWEHSFCDAEWFAEYLNRAWNGVFHTEYEIDDLSQALDIAEDELPHLLAFILVDLRTSPLGMIKPPETWLPNRAEKWKSQTAANLEQAVFLDRLQVLICRYKRENGHEKTVAPIDKLLVTGAEGYINGKG